MPELRREVFIEGLGFPEAPRWHDGRLWLSDMARELVVAIDSNGAQEHVCHVDGRPSGLGWMPDGTLLVVSMHQRQVLRLGPEGLNVHADLSSLVRANLNDMVVDHEGWAFVTNFGYDAASEDPETTGIVVVAPDGSASISAHELLRPNGCAISGSGTRFMVAETRVHRITVFDLADHRLSNPRVMGVLPSGTWADGMCLDAEEHAWVADPKGSHCFRVSPAGEVVTVIDTAPMRSIACALGGPDRRTLFITLSEELKPFGGDESLFSSRVDAVRVDVPGAGVP